MPATTISQFFGYAAVLLSVVCLNKVVLNHTLKIFLLFIGFLSISFFLTKNLPWTAVSFIAVSYFFLVSATLVSSFCSENGFRNLVLIFASATCISSVIGLYDLSTVGTGAQQLIGMGYENRLPSGTFKNGGQAGSYMMVAFASIFPVVMSDLKKKFSIFQRLFLFVVSILAVVYTLLSAKMASLVGIVCGIVFFILLRLNLRVIIVSAISLFLLPKLLDIISALGGGKIIDRLLNKYYSRLGGFAELDFGVLQNEFFGDNISTALSVFNRFPLFGSGLGGVKGVYNHYEIHSTYLMILAETGLVGSILYVSLMLSLTFLFFVKNRFGSNPYSSYLKNAFPLFVGMVVSWSYTFHLRKREFYIFLAIIIIANILAKRVNRMRINSWNNHQLALD